MSEEKDKLKITVLKVFKPEEVFKDPPIKTKEPYPCPVHKEGQTILVEGYNQPEGICGFAWNVIWPFAMMLLNKGDLNWYYEKPGTLVASCPDGFATSDLQDREIIEIYHPTITSSSPFLYPNSYLIRIGI